MIAVLTVAMILRRLRYKTDANSVASDGHELEPGSSVEPSLTIMSTFVDIFPSEKNGMWLSDIDSDEDDGYA